MKLELQNISYRYKSNLPMAIQNMNYSFETGKLYAVMGASGSGKTTLVSIISRLDKPSQGRILYDGVDIRQIKPSLYRSKKVGIIFQSYNLLYNYSVVDNIAVVLSVAKYKGNQNEKAAELLDYVKIPQARRNFCAKDLSGGEQQRVAIARALAGDPEIIVADEPTGNLDKINQTNVMEIFKDLAQNRGKCVIIVTHSEFVGQYADEVVNIDGGNIMETA
jgi:ABC-type antimicrobial peptide transport system, ATPase component